MLSLVRFALVMTAATWAAPQAFADCQPGSDVLASLRCLDGVTASEVNSSVAGYRQFELKFDQPVDHSNPNGEHFSQRVVLLHRNWADPMVLQTSGYSIFGVQLTALARTYTTNQIQVEHRYFSTSTPESLDWSHLDIEQSAHDFHRITVALKQLYQKRWVGTGASKGGMTSVFHRRFYPADLDGTVADVAPLSFTHADSRYVGFVDDVGGDRYAACRTALYNFQRTLLSRRGEFLDRIDGDFRHLGKNTAYEHAIIELPFAFWQYGNPEDRTFGCANVPAPNAPADEVFAFLTRVNDPAGLGADGFVTFQSYYYQAGTQLGAPAAKLNHLTGLRNDPYTLDQYMPKGVSYTYSDAAMLDVKQWVENDAQGILFVYGEFDPWTAGAFPRVDARDVHQFIAPAANHGAKFTALNAADRATARQILAGWFDRQPTFEEVEGATLDDLELQARRQFRLP